MTLNEQVDYMRTNVHRYGSLKDYLCNLIHRAVKHNLVVWVRRREGLWDQNIHLPSVNSKDLGDMVFRLTPPDEHPMDIPKVVVSNEAMFIARIFKQMPGEKHDFGVKQFVGMDKVTLFERSKAYIRKFYKDYCISRSAILTNDDATECTYYQWLVVHKTQVHNRAIIVVEIQPVDHVA